MSNRDHGFEVLAAIAVIAFIVLYFIWQEVKQNECVQRGGRVVDVHMSEGGWFCQEKP